MKNKKVKQNLFNKDTIALAQQLLGMQLVHLNEEGITSGIIVETEAYLFNDRACHAFHRRTESNEAMFAQAGTVYVYNIYGIYKCFNVVSNKKDVGEAVLIRALEPVQGIELMQMRRQAYAYTKTKKEFAIKDLCNGPSKLAMAMGFQKADSFKHLSDSNIWIEQGKEVNDFITTTRIGIPDYNDAHLPYRFYVNGNKYISKK
jgi:DNA-3-methyladenine glycosylase